MVRGIPNRLMLTDNRTKPITSSSLPTPTQATQMYEANGGHLTEESPFREDPIVNDLIKCRIRDGAFLQKYPSFEPMFHNLVNGNNSLFKDGLNFFIDITFRLSSSV